MNGKQSNYTQKGRSQRKKRVLNTHTHIEDIRHAEPTTTTNDSTMEKKSKKKNDT